MTTANAQRHWSPIGAMELKCSYHRNMTIAAATVSTAIALLIGSVAAVRGLTPVIPQTPKDTIFFDASHILPPPLVHKPPMQVMPPSSAPPKLDINAVQALPDDSVFEEIPLPTKGELENFTPPTLGGEGNGAAAVYVNPGDLAEILPDPGDFVRYEEAPVMLLLPTPQYPEIARKAGIEGTVYVEVLIDKLGKVRDARIVKASGARVGFEEAALEAAWKGEWRPAMQNKQPVAVRVSYPVTFRLK